MTRHPTEFDRLFTINLHGRVELPTSWYGDNVTVGRCIEWEADCAEPCCANDSLLDGITSVGTSSLPVPDTDKVDYNPIVTVLEEAALRLAEERTETYRAGLFRK